MTRTTVAQKVVLDCNIYDLLIRDDIALGKLVEMCSNSRLEIIVPSTLRRELENSPFGGVPDKIPVTYELDSVFILNHTRLGEGRLDKGDVYCQHKGKSYKDMDAVIVDTANKVAELFVTEDIKARKRVSKLGLECAACSYVEFRNNVLRV